MHHGLEYISSNRTPDFESYFNANPVTHTKHEGKSSAVFLSFLEWIHVPPATVKYYNDSLIHDKVQRVFAIFYYSLTK